MTDQIRRALEEAHDLLTVALRDYDQTKHWIAMQRAHLANGTSYDRDGGSSGDVADLSSRLLRDVDDDAKLSYARVVRPDAGTLYAKKAKRAAEAVVAAARDWDWVRRQNLTTVSLPPVVDEKPSCSHCGLAERARGSVCRRCHDWQQRNGELPTAEHVEAWRRGKQPKQRIAG